MAANLLSYKDEGLPVMEVSSTSNGNVTLKWGEDGAQQTTASLSTRGTLANRMSLLPLIPPEMSLCSRRSAVSWAAMEEG